ncbi:hypothetical protein FB451DRAFT_1285530, partial [Mycena latifolia]
MASIQIKSIVFNPRPDALKLTAKCYTPESSDPNRITLVCAHGAGTPKNGDSKIRLREVWAVDWQSHGEGAVVNEAALKNRPDAIAAFVKSTHLRDRHIVAVGHSAGASVVVMCSTDFFREFGEEHDSALSTAIMVPSRDEAFTYMRKNFIWKGWDPRDHGMRNLPVKQGVAISTNNEQEISAYANVPPHPDAVDSYRRIAPFVPVHFIFGARNDLVPTESQDSIFDPANNIRASSIQRVRRAGHMILQENTDGLAATISEALAQLSQFGAEFSKLRE